MKAECPDWDLNPGLCREKAWSLTGLDYRGFGVLSNIKICSRLLYIYCDEQTGTNDDNIVFFLVEPHEKIILQFLYTNVYNNLYARCPLSVVSCMRTFKCLDRA